MKQLLRKEDFFAKYNITREDFEKTNIDWGDMDNIYRDYLSRLPILETAARTISEILRTHQDVHTVRSRVKNPEHLIEKIIRKTSEKKKNEPNFEITLENYPEKVTDLIGIRVLHLYKDQAIQIDKMIRENWEPMEKVTIYHRKGDDDSLSDEQDPEFFEHKEHPVGYRSWHYLIASQITKHHYIAEIQVRTIFEEGWSEIDHQLRYPYHLDNELLKNQLLVLNRMAGSADEMVNNIRETLRTLEILNDEKAERDSLIFSLEEKVKALSKKNNVNQTDFRGIVDTLGKLKEIEFTIPMPEFKPDVKSAISSSLFEKLPSTILFNNSIPVVQKTNKKGT
ncbi:hypothetical protein [Priestia megaterium]|uniref:hypothetical protein n=1 Tax=Priestia megaterium TaxID=1404 RepID=UPI00263BD51F|nr:hypothetical protein [Priestia megaterium]MDN4862810.1 hypothetical protein [Priestia megaterium]